MTHVGQEGVENYTSGFVEKYDNGKIDQCLAIRLLKKNIALVSLKNTIMEKLTNGWQLGFKKQLFFTHAGQADVENNTSESLKNTVTGV